MSKTNKNSTIKIRTRPFVLIIRDGWGYNENIDLKDYDATNLADTPVNDDLMANYAHCLIGASGEDVGLPDSRGIFVPLRLTRGDLASMVGCRVETTIRVLKRWQREGLVETRREGLVIKNRHKLNGFMDHA